VSEEDKLCLLQAATSLVFPSLSEGFGLPLLEAFAAGTPVISSNTTSLAEIAGGSALSIDPEQTESVSHAMQTLAESTQLQSELVVLGRQRAAAFTWQTCADQTAAIYKQMAR
jgi:alpha-1,3-rhamnosyl/mannosyltransferase